MTEESSIDWEAVCQNLITENEQLSRRLLKQQTAYGPQVRATLDTARRFINENYLVIMVVLFVVSSLIAGLYRLYQDQGHE